MGSMGGVKSLSSLLSDCLKAGVFLFVSDGRLWAKGPYNPELHRRLQEHREELIPIVKKGLGYLWGFRKDWQLFFEPGTPLHVQEEIARRVLPPPGWPASQELPWWWGHFAMTETVLEAREHACDCGFSVLVRTAERPGWFCPQCAQPYTEAALT